MELKKFASLLSCTCLILCVTFKAVTVYNLDVESPLTVKGPNKTLFGYSVVLHSHRDQKWFVVGAPKANSSFDDGAVNPGVIYKCPIAPNTEIRCEELSLLADPKRNTSCQNKCLEDKDDQWLGVSMARQKKKDGHILACGHRWKNAYHSKEDILPYGVCFIISSNLQPTQNSPLIPCDKGLKTNFRIGEDHTACQAGISSFMTEDSIVIGAPGSHSATGTVFMKQEGALISNFEQVDSSTVKRGSYLGYAVSAGHFVYRNSTDVVGGAPQQDQTGRVYIFDTKDAEKWIIKFIGKGKMLGSYFGASVCAVDLNSDGLSDLLVGAPMYSTVREEGRVYVYLNTGLAKMKELKMELVGGNSYAARFGDVIVDIGDIDADGFPDVAIGAPQEDDKHGSIYIYNGRERGISSIFSQRINGYRIRNNLFGFGQSISGGIDVDGNAFSDVAVGAFMSDTVVLLRSRPVVILEASLLLPPSIKRTKRECTEYGKPAVCINVTLCFHSTGKEISGHIALQYNLHVDVLTKTGFPSRFHAISKTFNGTSELIEIYHNIAKCKTHQAILKGTVRDLRTPVQFEMEYFLGKHFMKNESKDTFSPLQPVLQQKEGESNIVRNKTYFERYCAFQDCAANLNVSAVIILKGDHVNKSYLPVQDAKIIILNVSLFNAGDDAYSSFLYVQFPNILYFIKVVEVEENQIHCELITGHPTTALNCSVGHVYVDALSRVGVTFLLDASRIISAQENIAISVNATCENEQHLDLLNDNFITLVLPLKYEVNLQVYGFGFPSHFYYGGDEEDKQGITNFYGTSCPYKLINFSYQVINMGNSKAPSTELHIKMPNTLNSDGLKLFEVYDIKSSDGKCQFSNHSEGCNGPEMILYQVYKFVWRTSRKPVSCSSHGISCLTIICHLGDIESRKTVDVHFVTKLNSRVLEMDSASDTQLFIEAVASTNDFKVIENISAQTATIILNALQSLQPRKYVLYMIVGMSCILGIILLFLFIHCLQKFGFFKRPKRNWARKSSWKYTDKQTNCDDDEQIDCDDDEQTNSDDHEQINSFEECDLFINVIAEFSSSLASRQSIDQSSCSSRTRISRVTSGTRQ
uniref:Integrin alpha-4 n=1 Tax=Callorhinchus milii TaxID=7868 RepID=V9KBK8_CALMI